MSSPPGPTPVPALREPRPEVDQSERLSVQTLSREARKVLGDLGFEVSQNRLVKVIQRYVRDGRSDVDFRTWFIAYADPTGEKATRRVMNERGY